MAGSMLGAMGFENRVYRDDRITVSLGAPTYYTTVAPGGSTRSMGSNGGGEWRLYRPWYDNTGAVLTPAGNTFWIHARSRMNSSNGTDNPQQRMGTSKDGVEAITVSFDVDGKLQIRVAGTVKATSALPVLSLYEWHRIIFSVDQVAGGGGYVRVYLSGNLAVADVIVEYLLTATDVDTTLAGMPNGFWAAGGSNSNFVDDFIAYDPAGTGSFLTTQDLTGMSVVPIRPTGNGADVAWVGDYTDVDEVPWSDTDDINVAAIDTRENFSFPATVSDRPLAVQCSARVTRTGTAAGANIEIYQTENLLNDDGGIIAAPGDGVITAIFDLQRDTTVWDAAAFDASDFGVVSRT